VGEQPRTVGRAHARDRQRVLAGERHAGERPGRLAARERRVQRRRLVARRLQARQDERVERAVAVLDPRQMLVEHLDRAPLTARDGPGDLGRALQGHRGIFA
jgi:hypothetical protein